MLPILMLMNSSSYRYSQSNLLLHAHIPLQRGLSRLLLVNKRKKEKVWTCFKNFENKRTCNFALKGEKKGENGMRGHCSLATEQSDYRSCLGKPGGSLFRPRLDWPASILFARQGPFPKYFIENHVLHRAVFQWFYYLAPWTSLCHYATALKRKPLICCAAITFARTWSTCSCTLLAT